MTDVNMDPVFVFGSNLAGRHGCCAAKFAYQFRGALMGKGEGLQGNSYAIPTKDMNLRTLPLYTIEYYINRFLKFALLNQHMLFRLTPIGCGAAGYLPSQIAPFFVDAPPNVLLPDPSHDLASAEFTRIILNARNGETNP